MGVKNWYKKNKILGVKNWYKKNKILGVKNWYKKGRPFGLEIWLFKALLPLNIWGFSYFTRKRQNGFDNYRNFSLKMRFKCEINQSLPYFRTYPGAHLVSSVFPKMQNSRAFPNHLSDYAGTISVRCGC